MDNYIGRLLDNRYEIQEVIGMGGMAVVYKARCHRLNRMVAIKILKDELSRDDEFRRRFHAESQAVAMLSHPNIVSVYDVSTSSDADYIVMELIDGITLKQYMDKKGTLNWKETLHFAIQIAKALEHAHSRGIVHRDIKPHNIMVLKNGSVKVADFGIARVMSKGNTLTKEALGSVHYISPEQAKGGRVDNRSDIYSLGVVMYEMMTGRPPYDGESPVAIAIKHINGGAPRPSTLNSNIPFGLEQIIMKAMGHEPDDRYDTATAIIQDLDEFRKDPNIVFNYPMPAGVGVDAALNTAATTVLPSSAQLNERIPGSVRPASSRTGTVGQIGVNRNTGRVAPAGAVNRNTGRMPASGAAARTTGRVPAGAAGRTTGGVSTRTGSIPYPNGKPPVKRPTPEQRRAAESKRRAEEAEERNKLATVAIIACSVVAILAIAIFLVTLFGNGKPTTPETVNVPSFVGKDYSTLEKVEGLQVILQDRKYDPILPVGQIISQTPEAGEKVALGTKVYLDVSMGPEPSVKVMPDLTEIDQLQAQSNLDAQQMKLQVLFRNDYSDTVPKGYVTKTDPVQGTELTEGQIIYVYISQGPEVVTDTIPNVVGMSLQTAIGQLKECGFKNIRHEYVKSDKPRDEVVSQSEEPYAQVDVNTTIILEVSDNSIKKDVVPNVVGRDVVTASNLLNEKKFSNVKIEYADDEAPKDQVIRQSVSANTTIELTEEIVLTVSNGPKPTEPTKPPVVSKQVTFVVGTGTTEEYKVVIRDPGGNPVYEGSFTAGEKTITLALEGNGTVNYDIYVNDTLANSQKVDFTTP